VSRRRRALVLGGLAVALGTLSAADVARREAALREHAGPAVGFLVAAESLDAGRRVRGRDLELRRAPARYAPLGGPAEPALLVGQRLAVPVPAGAQVTPAQLAANPSAPLIRRGERAAEVVAAGSPDAIGAGARVDVLVTRERADGGPGATELALEDVEVLAARPARQTDRAGPAVAATLRVTVRQAVYLTAAASFAREIRLLARAPGDRRRAGGVVIGDDLR
jgi:pilus assembly protein CpaB